MNCLTLTSRCCEFIPFFGVVFQWENATKSVFLCEKWRTKFPTSCYSFQPLTHCIGLQQFSGTFYWGIKTLWSQFWFSRNGCMHEESFAPHEGKGYTLNSLHFCLWSTHSFTLLFLCASVHTFEQLLCWAPWKGRYLQVCLQQPRRCWAWCAQCAAGRKEAVN